MHLFDEWPASTVRYVEGDGRPDICLALEAEEAVSHQSLPGVGGVIQDNNQCQV